MHLPKEKPAITTEPNTENCVYWKLVDGMFSCMTCTISISNFIIIFFSHIFFMCSYVVFVQASINEGGIQTLRDLLYTCAGCV